MRYKHLGSSSSLNISTFALGTAIFGSVTEEGENQTILDKAVDAGVNLIDTVNSYNWKHEDTCTENLLGRWLYQNPSRRQQTLLATKVYGTVGNGPNDSGLPALHIKRVCDDSLRRLRTSHIDLYQIHYVDRSTPWEEIWQAMEQLIQEGKVIYVGGSSFATWHISMAQCVARQRYTLGLISEQSVYNLTNRVVELEVLPACQKLGLGFLVYSPLAGGRLSEKTIPAN